MVKVFPRILCALQAFIATVLDMAMRRASSRRRAPIARAVSAVPAIVAPMLNDINRNSSAPQKPIAAVSSMCCNSEM